MRYFPTPQDNSTRNGTTPGWDKKPKPDPLTQVKSRIDDYLQKQVNIRGYPMAWHPFS